MKEMDPIRSALLNPRNLIVTAIVLVIVFAVFREWWDDTDEFVGQSELLQTRPAGCEYFYVPPEYIEIVFMTDPGSGPKKGMISMICVTTDIPDNIIKTLHQYLDQQGWKPLDYLLQETGHGPGWHALNSEDNRGPRWMWAKCWIDDHDNMIQASILCPLKVQEDKIRMTLHMFHFDYAVWKNLIDAARRTNELDRSSDS